MSAPLHMESSGGADNDDVLASIRRLISSGDAAAPPLAQQGAAPGSPSPNVPFRLRPDALVATSDMGVPPAAPAPPRSLADPALLSPGRAERSDALGATSAMGVASEPLADPAPRSLADPALLSPGRTDSAPLSRNLAEDAQAPHIAPPPTAPTAACAAATIPAARPEPQSDDEGTDMHALHPTTAPHFHPDATAEPAAAEAPPQLHIPAPASTTPDAAPADNPLRALLRGAVRDELEREMRHRLETDLRQLIRTELSAALTEALARPAAA
ncbi:MAG TPA: hypothetical protein GXX24_03620 [Paracoccus solventivorans]|uniref:Uncharacterized protein n=1 Tax=Paracoccus solventivorans TaxID=53463 RepID=A0A832PLH7_9RHOB|nr:hypothetical protein [Paracoccus solventivorans]HHW33215.1 hypothetical protein [Paracoccus solventivorans]